MADHTSSTSGPRKCQLCQTDRSVSQEQKASNQPLPFHRSDTNDPQDKLWDNPSALSGHVSGVFHNRFHIWSRNMQLASDRDGYTCPYGCGRSYDHLSSLVRHIKQAPTQKTLEKAPDHDAKKRRAGWYRADWDRDDISADIRRKQRAYYKAKYQPKGKAKAGDGAVNNNSGEGSDRDTGSGRGSDAGNDGGNDEGNDEGSDPGSDKRKITKKAPLLKRKGFPPSSSSSYSSPSEQVLKKLHANLAAINEATSTLLQQAHSLTEKIAEVEEMAADALRDAENAGYRRHRDGQDAGRDAGRVAKRAVRRSTRNSVA
ncbi:hypothetical protein PVAG01_07925 [Phlyctema vagabunda]|uniref:C2H2-type domain-containing protein n=1 Tax=Phlyctema vagabunda TaxID=108571 RepID=A0ABR4PDT0_9HELO